MPNNYMTTTIKFNNGRVFEAEFNVRAPKRKQYAINGVPLSGEAAYMRELKRITVANCAHAKRTGNYHYDMTLPYSERMQVYNRVYEYTPLTKRGRCDKCGLLVTPTTI